MTLNGALPRTLPRGLVARNIATKVAAAVTVGLRASQSEHVRRNEYRGAEHRETDQKRNDRKTHHLADIQLRDRE